MRFLVTPTKLFPETQIGVVFISVLTFLVNLNVKCIYSLLFLSTFVSCSLLEKEEIDNSICPDGDCWVRLYTDFEEDSNEYHHIEPYWSSENSGRFNIHIESSPTIGRCQYNGMTVVSSRFDSDSYWEIESGLSFTFGLYNPFESFYTQQGDIIKVRDTTVTLDYFQGQIQPIVQETSIYHDVKDKMECYAWSNPKSGNTPLETGNCILYSKRIVGPIVREMIGDTLKIYSETFFDCGMGSKFMRDSINVIIN